MTPTRICHSTLFVIQLTQVLLSLILALMFYKKKGIEYAISNYIYVLHSHLPIPSLWQSP